MQETGPVASKETHSGWSRTWKLPEKQNWHLVVFTEDVIIQSGSLGKISKRIFKNQASENSREKEEKAVA